MWVVLGFGLFWALGSCGLLEPDEARTAGKAFEFYQAGTWLEPRLYGLGQFNKPPLVYWVGALCYYVGGVNEWMARLPSALAALGTLLLVRSLAGRLLGLREAWAVTLGLLTAPLFFVMARLVDPNMMLTLWITLGMWAAVAWFEEGRPWQRWSFYAALAGGFLTKGPVAVMVVVLALVGYRFWRGGAVPWRSLWHWPGAVLGAAVSLSWFVLVAIRHPELTGFFLGKEIAGRLASDVHHKHRSFLYYFWVFPVALLPWLPALGVGLGQAWRRRDATDRLLLAWVGLPLLMFTLVKGKMPAYLLPLCPPAVMLIGRALVDNWHRSWFRRVQSGLVLFLAILVAPGLAWYGRLHYGWTELFRSADLVWLVPVVGGGCFLTRGRRSAAAVVLLGGYLAAWGLWVRHDDDLGGKRTFQAVAGAMRPLLQGGDRVILFRTYPRGLSFYLQRRITIPNEFEMQISSDAVEMADRYYQEPEEYSRVYEWFDTEPRVFVVTTYHRHHAADGAGPSGLELLQTHCRRPLREVYRDRRSVVVCNFP